MLYKPDDTIIFIGKSDTIIASVTEKTFDISSKKYYLCPGTQHEENGYIKIQSIDNSSKVEGEINLYNEMGVITVHYNFNRSAFGYDNFYYSTQFSFFSEIRDDNFTERDGSKVNNIVKKEPIIDDTYLFGGNANILRLSG